MFKSKMGPWAGVSEGMDAPHAGGPLPGPATEDMVEFKGGFLGKAIPEISLTFSIAVVATGDMFVSKGGFGKTTLVNGTELSDIDCNGNECRGATVCNSMV